MAKVTKVTRPWKATAIDVNRILKCPARQLELGAAIFRTPRYLILQRAPRYRFSDSSGRGKGKQLQTILLAGG